MTCLHKFDIDYLIAWQQNYLKTSFRQHGLCRSVHTEALELKIHDETKCTKFRTDCLVNALDISRDLKSDLNFPN